MAEFMKLKTRERQQKFKQAKANEREENQENLAQGRENDVNVLSSRGQVNQEPSQRNSTKEAQQKQNQPSHTSLNQQQLKSYCAPGTMSLFLQMRKNQASNGQRVNMNDVQQPNEDSHLSNDEMDLIEDDESIHDVATNAPNAVTEKKKHRGRTILANIHGRTMEERDVIVLNDLRQVVGPTTHIARTFARFLGTIARSQQFAPLNIISWSYMPTKDQIWEYIQTKYIIPEEAKDGVLSNVGTKWQWYKTKLREKHFSEDETMQEMLDRRPKDIPECQFKELLEYWNTDESKEASRRNKANRAKQNDMHTLGPTLIATLHHEMQQNDSDKRCPSQADLYMVSRKRKDGRTYLTQNDETLQNIEKMKALQSLDDGSVKSDPYYGVMGKNEHSGRLRMYGLGVTKSSLKNKDPKNPFILPPIFLESICQQLEQKLEEVDKRREARFEQKLATMLSNIRAANPGIDLVIPDFPTDEGDASSSQQD